MGNKIHENAVKNYHPELMECPFCKAKLKYRYALSNKVVQFTSGKYFRIKNLAYSCSCSDTIYFSQTANKLCFKGNTYSTKIVCMIDYYKNKHLGRESICDILASKGIEISDRNVDSLFKKFKTFLEMDKSIIFEAYQDMMNKFNHIRLSIDCISICEIRYIIMYDYFTGNKLAIWKIHSSLIQEFKKELSLYINQNYNIKVIITVRNLKGGVIVPMLKELASEDCKFLAYDKF